MGIRWEPHSFGVLFLHGNRVSCLNTVAFGRREMHTLAQEVSLAWLRGFGSPWASSLRCMIRKLVLWFLTSQESSSLLGTHPLAARSFHKMTFTPSLSPSSEISALHFHCTGQTRSGHSRDLYIKILLWGFLYIVFLYLFSMAWGESWQTVNLILILPPADIFWLPGKNLCYQGQYIALSDQYCTLQNSQIPPMQPYIIF